MVRDCNTPKSLLHLGVSVGLLSEGNAKLVAPTSGLVVATEETKRKRINSKWRMVVDVMTRSRTEVVGFGCSGLELERFYDRRFRERRMLFSDGGHETGS